MVAVMVVFVAANLAVVAANGARTGGDSYLYLDGANHWLNAQPLSGREPSYIGYIVLIAFTQSYGGGLLSVVLTQILAGAAATAAVYAMAASVGGRASGLVAAGLVVLDVDSNRWHHYILSDSIYTSLAVIGVLLAYRASTRAGIEPLLTACALIVCAALVRPEGWLLLPAIALTIMVLRPGTTAQRIAGGGAIVAIGVGLLAIVAPAVSGNIDAVGPAEMLRRGQTIWDYDGWRIVMPQDDAPGVLSYALAHPLHTLTLMAARVGVHFAHVRPFFSTAHNAVIVLWLVPVYCAAIFGAWRQRHSPMTVLIVTALASQTLVVALTHAESDGRYLAHVMPLLYVLAGAAIADRRAAEPA